MRFMEFDIPRWQLVIALLIFLSVSNSAAEGSRLVLDKTRLLEITIDFMDLPTRQRLIALRSKRGTYKVTCLMDNKQVPGSSKQAFLEIDSKELEEFVAAAGLVSFKTQQNSSEREKTSVHNLRDLVCITIDGEGRLRTSRLGYAELNPSCVKAVDQLFSRAFHWN